MAAAPDEPSREGAGGDQSLCGHCVSAAGHGMGDDGVSCGCVGMHCSTWCAELPVCTSLEGRAPWLPTVGGPASAVSSCDVVPPLLFEVGMTTGSGTEFTVEKAVLAG